MQHSARSSFPSYSLRIVAPLFHDRTLVRIYAYAAVALVPWIVLLAVVQPIRGVANSFPWVAGGLVAAVGASSLATALLWYRRHDARVVGLTFTGSFALVTLWFEIVGQPRSASRLVQVVVVLLVPVGVSAWLLARTLLLDRPVPNRARWPTLVHLGIAGVQVIALVRISSFAPSEVAVHHQKLTWTGLDAFELVGLAATAWCLHRRSSLLPMAAAFTASLLLADAWTNVVSSGRDARLEALAMAVVELSLAAVSIVIAVRATTVSSIASRRKPAGAR